MEQWRKGMTIVELLIVIVVLGLLAGLGAFGYQHMQESSLIKKHHNNAQNLASILDELYTTGSSPDGTTWEKGTYPSTNQLQNMWSNLVKHHDGLPSNLGLDVAVQNSSEPYEMLGFLSNHDCSEHAASHYDNLVYQALTNQNQLCKQEDQTCTKFNIYYFKKQGRQYLFSEAIESKHR